MPKADAAQATVSDEKRWIDESVVIAKSAVYASVPVDQGETPFVLSDDYKTRARVIAEEQITLAGVRLGRLLNQALK